eukprot:TRINITY_DN1586_c0_g1_i3.p1 TRINITY_DN1586_c0_g1~~TRINITY_DN1586_c0_g1_i3.p1  ORF type:complete len:612 (-),score=121.91 TRINITY_DN1586_c0_g1_i3:21-1856(-)
MYQSIRINSRRRFLQLLGILFTLAVTAVLIDYLDLIDVGRNSTLETTEQNINPEDRSSNGPQVPTGGSILPATTSKQLLQPESNDSTTQLQIGTQQISTSQIASSPSTTSATFTAFTPKNGQTTTPIANAISTSPKQNSNSSPLTSTSISTSFTTYSDKRNDSSTTGSPLSTASVTATLKEPVGLSTSSTNNVKILETSTSSTGSVKVHSTSATTGIHMKIIEGEPALNSTAEGNVTSRLLSTSPYFDFRLYREGEEEMMWTDYAAFHSMVLSGKVPRRYFILTNTYGVGLGNRFEQLQWGLLFAVLSSRAFISEWKLPFHLNQIINTTDLYFNWVEHDERELTRSLKVTSRFSDGADISYFVGNTSLIEGFGNVEGVLFPENFRVVLLPGVLLYSNPEYRDVIPRVMGNWKTSVMQRLFKRPVDPAMKMIQEIKKQIPNNPNLLFITAQLRVHQFHGHTPTRPERMWGCLDYFRANHSKSFNDTLFFLSADEVESRKEAKEKLGEQLLTLESMNIEPVHVMDTDAANYDANLLGVIVDWWMIGEGDLKVLTYKSSFGGTAADRTKSPRFLIDYENQCINGTQPHYMENIYVNPLDSYQKYGEMLHLDQQK